MRSENENIESQCCNILIITLIGIILLATQIEGAMIAGACLVFFGFMAIASSSTGCGLWKKAPDLEGTRDVAVRLETEDSVTSAVEFMPAIVIDAALPVIETAAVCRSQIIGTPTLDIR